MRGLPCRLKFARWINMSGGDRRDKDSWHHWKLLFQIDTFTRHVPCWLPPIARERALT